MSKENDLPFHSEKLQINIPEDKIVPKTSNHHNADSDEDDKEDQIEPNNAIQEFFNLKIIEKIYGIHPKTRLYDIKEIIKDSLRKRKESKELTPKKESKKIINQRIKNIWKNFSKNRDKNPIEFEAELEDICEIKKDNFNIIEDIFQKIVSKNTRNEVEFSKYNILYNLSKFKNYDKMYFSLILHFQQKLSFQFCLISI